MRTGSTREQAANRLLKLRQVMGLGDRGGSTAWANFLGIGQTRWSNIESGRQRLSHDVEDRIIANCPEASPSCSQSRVIPGLSQMWLRRLGYIG